MLWKQKQNNNQDEDNNINNHVISVRPEKRLFWNKYTETPVVKSELINTAPHYRQEEMVNRRNCRNVFPIITSYLLP